jgi:ParB/RepB/Spo0J family partition protein
MPSSPGKYQPRTRMDETALAELAESIRSQGLMQPILARPIPGGRYEIIAGERRWRASQLAGLSEVHVLVRDVPDDLGPEDGAHREHPARRPQPLWKRRKACSA